MTFSGLWDQAKERLQPLQTQLFPRQVLLELQDDGLRGQVLQGPRPQPVSLEAPLPPLTCRDGLPLEVEPLGDLIGDLLVRDNILDGHVLAAIPPAAVSLRVLSWSSGVVPDGDPIDLVRALDPPLRLPMELEEACLDLAPLPGDPARMLLAAVSRTVVDRWVEVFNIAGAHLDRLAAPQSCQLAALEDLLASCPENDLVGLLDPFEDGCRLILFKAALPVFERQLPLQDDALIAELQRCLSFYDRQDPRVAGLRLLCTRDLPVLQRLGQEIGVGPELITPEPFGSLVLQGLSLPDPMP
ncbi:MAG: hypothetical protein VKI83_09870 [Synechococcaceae cyanobacterium]|nr:hypothetical protein [Synechococcaceae cyanobacterium]